MIDNFIQIAQLIAKFQAIEVSMKVFLAKQQLEQDKINNAIKDSYSVSEYVDMSYGVLLKRYKKSVGASVLYDRLFALKDYRDYIVHQGFVAASNVLPNDMKEFAGIDILDIDYFKLNIELDECIANIRSEYIQLYM